MTVTISPANLRDMTYIAANMREADRREIGAVIDEPATVIACMMFEASQGFRWCAYLDGQPVCAFGVAQLFVGLGSGWAFGTKDMPHVMRAVTVFCRRSASRRAAVEFRRIEVRTAVDHPDSHRWLGSLGFVREGVAVDYGAGGRDFATYAATHKSAARVIKDASKRTFVDAGESVQTDG